MVRIECFCFLLSNGTRDVHLQICDPSEKKITCFEDVIISKKDPSCPNIQLSGLFMSQLSRASSFLGFHFLLLASHSNFWKVGFSYQPFRANLPMEQKWNGHGVDHTHNINNIVMDLIFLFLQLDVLCLKSHISWMVFCVRNSWPAFELKNASKVDSFTCSMWVSNKWHHVGS